MVINNYILLYDGALLTTIRCTDNLQLRFFSDFFNSNSIFPISLSHDFKENSVINSVIIDLSFPNSIETINRYFPKIDINLIKDNKLYKYLTVLKSLKYGHGFVDLSDYSNIFSSLCEIMSSRNYECLNSFLKNYKKNKLICFFLLRDVIENIKVYIYFLMDGPDNHLNLNGNIFDNPEFSSRIEQLRGTRKLNFNFKKILKEHSELEVYNDEFNQIEKIGQMCNDYIHKNGYRTMQMLFLRNVNENKLLDYMLYILKTYFSLIVSFDGKNISSSDYIDYLDLGANPPENSQYWVAPIYEDFIKSEFSEEEIDKMKRNTYMFI